MEGPITGVVLAAGAAVRMGEPKLLLPLGGSTVLNTTLASVEASEVDRVIVVTGANASLIESSIVAERASVVRNPDYRRGNMSSFLTATATDPARVRVHCRPGRPPDRSDECHRPDGQAMAGGEALGGGHVIYRRCRPPVLGLSRCAGLRGANTRRSGAGPSPD